MEVVMDRSAGMAYATGMTTPSPTLADAVLREMWSRDSYLTALTSRPMADWRWKIAKAHKFVLDLDMSSFLSDLTHAPFTRHESKLVSSIDAMRHGAMPPHPVVWMEVDGRALQNRQIDMIQEVTAAGWKPFMDPWGKPHKTDKSSVESKWGFLVWQDPQVETVVHGVHFFSGGIEMTPDDALCQPMMSPFEFVWNCADQPFPFKTYDPIVDMMMLGVQGFMSPYIGCVVDWDAPICREKKVQVQVINEDDGSTRLVPNIIPETAGCARYIMAFLATINDIPILTTDVKAGKGYMARGNYRKFVDHTVVRLNIPQSVSRRKVADRALGAARRRAHDVRGHWRLYQRGEGVLCKPDRHEWGGSDLGGHQSCGSCPAWRTWIKPFQRGDSSLGIATHSYAVTHNLKGDKKDDRGNVEYPAAPDRPSTVPS